MIILTAEEIKNLHSLMMLKTGGADGVRNEELLQSAVASAFDSYFGVEKYPSLEEKVARLCYGIISNHPFVDGNKRTGIYAMLVMLDVNGVKLSFSHKEIIDLGLNVASGEWGYEEILRVVKKNCQNL